MRTESVFGRTKSDIEITKSDMERSISDFVIVTLGRRQIAGGMGTGGLEDYSAGSPSDSSLPSSGTRKSA